MSTYIMLFLLLCFITICIIAVIALNPKSKACIINTKCTAEGFNLTFKTNEKSTPSNQE
jgi:hypothetical protein